MHGNSNFDYSVSNNIFDSKKIGKKIKLWYIDGMETIMPTKQRKPSFGKGGVPTPPGFEVHPERRHNGAWKKEDTARYKLEQMLKMPEQELKELAADKNAPLFERKLATCIAGGHWKEIEGMMNQVYGQPKQKIETTVTAPKPLVNLTERKKNGE